MNVVKDGLATLNNGFGGWIGRGIYRTIAFQPLVTYFYYNYTIITHSSIHTFSLVFCFYPSIDLAKNLLNSKRELSPLELHINFT